jgi:hypothetical protein
MRRQGRQEAARDTADVSGSRRRRRRPCRPAREPTFPNLHICLLHVLVVLQCDIACVMYNVLQFLEAVLASAGQDSDANFYNLYIYIHIYIYIMYIDFIKLV